MYINLHTHHPDKNHDGIEVVNVDIHSKPDQPPPLYSAGIHPWYVGESSDVELKKLRNLVYDERLVAIGECGLDKLKGPALDVQTEFFKTQIKLSEELHLPLIIHCVKAYSDIIKLRKDFLPKQAWIFHGFNASKETAEQALRHDFYFSFGKALLNDRSKACQVLPFIPTNRLFLETDDDPQLSISSVYRKSSELLNIEESQLQVIIKNNFKYLFNVD